MDPRGAIQPQTLVGPDEEAEQLTMSFRNLVPELRGFETFGIAECQDAPMERQTWPSRESHSWQPGVTADSGNYFDFRHKSTLKELAKRWDNMDPERRVVITESEGENEVYHGPDTAETWGDCLPGFYCRCCEPWTHFLDQDDLLAHEQELATRPNIFCREKKNLAPDDELSNFDNVV
jgi:hypothetical protein